MTKTIYKPRTHNRFLLLPIVFLSNVWSTYPRIKHITIRINVQIFLLCLLCPGYTNAQDTVAANSTSFNIKIATWNIQMLPTCFAFFTKDFRKKQRVRAPWIIEYCNSHKYDVIVFQEVFDKNIKKKLERELKVFYPYQVNPRKKPGSLLSNGILIVSRVPMKYIDHIFFEQGTHADKWASKGCTLVEIEKNRIKFQIAGTHLQSSNTKKAVVHRIKQYQAIRSLLENNINIHVPLFVLGDMNTPKSNKVNYLKMLNKIGVKDVELNEKKPYTIDSINYWNPHQENRQLDYILIHSNNTSSKIKKQKIIRPKNKFKEAQMDLSDHYGIVAEIEIVND